MALLDFTDVILDPDLASGFSVLRRTETVSTATGRSTTTSAQIDNLLGVITFTEAGKNVRGDDGQSTGRSITVVTNFRLYAASDGVQPDIVLFQGQQFTVKQIDGMTNFGSGFVVAICELMQASTPPLT